ncbi:MAG: hypothetical protein JXK94_01015, partial [Deltaproteobacteria bacterium]|nr:hypothetical protein [Deltaproteobacteria bacterium]
YDLIVLKVGSDCFGRLKSEVMAGFLQTLAYENFDQVMTRQWLRWRFFNKKTRLGDRVKKMRKFLDKETFPMDNLYHKLRVIQTIAQI